ncbi:MAG: hypothetical protein H7233_10870 [Pseudorhodobacter sp.]|nr:hypothetical protein [Frankiaceae bacterium]
MSTGLLLVGYVLAVPFTVFVPGFLRLWRRREPWVFVATEVGALLIAAGWAMQGGTGAAVFNAGFAVVLAIAYALEGRKRARLSS